MEVGNLTNRYLRPQLEAPGSPRIRIHDLRHSAATLMLGANVNVKIVSQMLGHSQTAFTMHRYSTSAWLCRRQAAQAVDSILSR